MGFSVLRAAALASLIAGSTSCILISSSSGDQQCETDADCEGLSGEALTCDTTSNVCVSVDPSTTATTTTSTSTSTGQGGGEPTGCQSNAQCIDENGQLPYICLEPGGECVSLLSEQCTEFFGDIEGLRDENPILVGLVTRYTGDTEENLLSSEIVRNGVRLALEEIDKVALGLPVGPNNTRRRLYAVSCNEAEDFEAAVSHLTETLDVPVMLGVEDPQRALDLALSTTIPQGRLFYQMIGESEAWATIDDNGLVWVGSLFGDSMSRTIAKVYNVSEPELELFFAKPEIRIAEVIRNDISGLEQAGGLEAEILVNGLSAGQAAKQGTFARFVYEPEPDDVSDLALAIQDFEPDVIVAFGVSTENAQILDVTEATWPAELARPFWLFDYSGYDYPVEFAIESLMAGGEQTIADRVIGVRPYLPPDRSNYDSFGIRYRSRFDNQSPGTLAGPLPYDSIYNIAYAIVGAGSAPSLTGQVIAEGFAKLNPPGAQIDVGPSEVGDAISALKANTNIDFQGTVSEYQWNLSNGTARQHQSTWCYAPAGTNNVTSLVTGITWDPVTDEISGDLGPCRKWALPR